MELLGEVDEEGGDGRASLVGVLVVLHEASPFLPFMEVVEWFGFDWVLWLSVLVGFGFIFLFPCLSLSDLIESLCSPLSRLRFFR